MREMGIELNVPRQMIDFYHEGEKDLSLLLENTNRLQLIILFMKYIHAIN